MAFFFSAAFRVEAAMALGLSDKVLIIARWNKGGLDSLNKMISD